MFYICYNIRMISNYETAKHNAASLFMEYNQREIISDWNLKSDADFIYLVFIGKHYRVNRSSGLIERIEEAGAFSEAGYNEAMTIYDLLCHNKAKVSLSNEMVELRNLSEAQTAWGSNDRTFYEKECAAFDKDESLLISGLERIGGIRTDGADVAFLVPVFRDIFVVVKFWHSDEDFPAIIKFYWDKNIKSYMHFETLWFACGHIVHEIFSNF